MLPKMIQGPLLVFALLAAACGEPREVAGVFDAGTPEPILNKMTGKVPEVDGLVPAIRVSEGEFPLLMTQCFNIAALNADRIVDYIADREWKGEGVLYTDSLDLSLDLDDFDLDPDGCFEIPVARANVPADVLTQVSAAAKPVMVDVTILITVDEPRSSGVQRFEPFWIVPDS